MKVLAAFLLICGFALAAAQFPLTSGTPYYSYTYQFQFRNFSFTPVGNSFVLNVSTDSAGEVFAYVAQGYQPDFEYYTYSLTSLTNPVQSLTIPNTQANGTWYITIYGYAAPYSYFYVTATNGVPANTELIDGVVDTGYLAPGQSTFYQVTITENVYDFSLIVITSQGDPDQTLVGSSSQYVNTSSTWGSACITALFPLAGEYTYKLTAYGSYSFTYATGFFENYGSSCQLPGNFSSESSFIRFDPVPADLEKMREHRIVKLKNQAN